MSKNRRSRGHQATAPSQPSMSYDEAASMLKSLSGFEGANQSSRRTWIYWPTLDTKRELDSYSAREIRKKSRWLQANMGLPNRVCSGLADAIGYLSPLSNSGNEDYDNEIDALWDERANEPLVLDAAGQFGINQMQIQLNKSALGDGDVLPVLINGSTEGIMIAAYEAHQIVSPAGAHDNWFDGVLIDKFRRHVAYGLCDDGGKVKTVSAKDALYYSHPDALGRIRPPSALKHAINHLQDITDILADTKLAIKVASQIGFYLKNAIDNPGGNMGPRAISGNLRNEQQAPASTGTAEDPSVPYKVEDFFRANGGVANLPKGTDVGTLQDTRPHPQQIVLMDYLIRDIAWGVGVAPEILWSIEKLGGANVRFIYADFERWIAIRLMRQRNWLNRFRAVWVAGEIEAGRLRQPPAGAKFWKAAYLPQASMTADKGRVGNLNIALVQNQMRSLATHFAEEGKDWQAELRQIAKEKRTLQELSLALEDVPKKVA